MGDIPTQDAASKARPVQFRDLFLSLKKENGILRSLSLAEVHDFRHLLTYCRREFHNGPGVIKILHHLAADLRAHLGLPDNDTETLNRMTIREIVEALQPAAEYLELTLSRLRFDEQTLTAVLDERSYSFENPKAFLLYRLIAEKGQPITRAEIRKTQKGLRRDKTIPNLLRLLHVCLRHTLKSSPAGHWLHLPPPKKAYPKPCPRQGVWQRQSDTSEDTSGDDARKEAPRKARGFWRDVRGFFQWAHQDSNLEPRDYESPALPLSYGPVSIYKALLLLTLHVILPSSDSGIQSI